MSRVGIVLVNGVRAGMIAEDDTGISFTYDLDYVSSPDTVPVSLTLPKRIDPYVSKTMLPFFDGLIPEGWLLEIAERHWKLNPRDRMGLLLAACRNTIGSVTVIDASEGGIP